MFPNADVPVVQLSINALQPLGYHLEVGARLAPLRDQGILIVGSGNVVHNLRRIAWDDPRRRLRLGAPLRCAARQVMLDAPGDIGKLTEHDDYPRAVPTPDHFIPLLYIAALAAGSNETPHVLVDGYAYGSLSMTCFTVGVDCPADHAGEGAAELPRPELVPPEQSNT